MTEPQYIDIVQGKRADTRVEVHIANAEAPGSQRKPITLVEAAAG